MTAQQRSPKAGRERFSQSRSHSRRPQSGQQPRLDSLDPAALALALIAAVLVFRLHAGTVLTIGVTAGLGLAIRLLLG